MIDDQLDKNSELIHAALNRVNRQIERIVYKLDSAGDMLLSDKISIARAYNARVEILSYFSEYNNAAREVADSFVTIGPEIIKDFAVAGIDVEFTNVDADIIRVFADDTFGALVTLGQSAAVDVGGMVYSSVLSSGNMDDLIDEIKQRIVGQTDKRGIPMSAHAKTLAETKYMEIDAAITKRKSGEAGIDMFKYTGSLIKDSRQWCEDHRNDVLTMEEIGEWADKQWQGKAPGDPFLMRGGYNCRHRWVPVQ